MIYCTQYAMDEEFHLSFIFSAIGSFGKASFSSAAGERTETIHVHNKCSKQRREKVYAI